MSEDKQKPAILLLKWPLAILLLAVVAAALFAGGTFWYWRYEQKNDIAAKRALQEAQSRLANANKEAEDLRTSVSTLKSLIQDGIFEPESRLDWIEMANDLQRYHKLSKFEYDISPQRIVPPPAGLALTAIDLQASRVRIKAQSLHEGDMLAFVARLTEPRRGFYPVERCHFRLLGTVPDDPVAPRLEAECLLDWITIKDKRAPLVAASATPNK